MAPLLLLLKIQRSLPAHNHIHTQFESCTATPMAPLLLLLEIQTLPAQISQEARRQSTPRAAFRGYLARPSRRTG